MDGEQKHQVNGIDDRERRDQGSLKARPVVAIAASWSWVVAQITSPTLDRMPRHVIVTWVRVAFGHRCLLGHLALDCLSELFTIPGVDGWLSKQFKLYKHSLQRTQPPFYQRGVVMWRG